MQSVVIHWKRDNALSSPAAWKLTVFQPQTKCIEWFVMYVQSVRLTAFVPAHVLSFLIPKSRKLMELVT
jgi:hypothetical protein